jgi:diadenylate cyclase
MNWTWITHTWRPVLEISLLTVVIYHICVLVRGTRGAAVVTGFIAVMLVATLITTLLELEVLNLLIKSFFAFIAIAVLVIFQPELRHILAELGNRPFLGTAREQRENIEVIIQAAARMSEMRIGALMAFEQTIQLQDIIQTGVRIDCDASPEMLETIFFPNNAIHDGGVVIKGDRIAFAACIFPLTQRQDLNPSLGTRHRAAIGLSEESDAVMVVVSEETGSISYAYKGQWVRGVSEESLRAFLSSVFIRPARSRNLAEILLSWKNAASKRGTGGKSKSSSPGPS